MDKTNQTPQHDISRTHSLTLTFGEGGVFQSFPRGLNILSTYGMYLEPLVLVGRGLVLGELTFKNRGQFGSRFFWIGFSWFFLNAELQPLANWQR